MSKLAVVIFGHDGNEGMVRWALSGADLLIVGSEPTGVEPMARAIARANGVEVLRFGADWDGLRRGDRAGRVRRMAEAAQAFKALGYHVEAYVFEGQGSRSTERQLSRMGLVHRPFPVTPGTRI